MATPTKRLPDSITDEVRATYHFLDRLLPESRDFEIRLWDNTCAGFTAHPRFTLVFNSPGVLRRILRPPLELSLAEAFIRRDFDIEGDVFAAIHFFGSLASRISENFLALLPLWFNLPVERHASPLMKRRAAVLRGKRHSKERERAAVQYHYDVGNDFYALWLDKRMVYSCAYFPAGTEDIDAAQEQKLELTCRKLRLQPGETLLDIGCGWGGLVIHAAQRYGVKALGVTLSEQQHRLAVERLAAAGIEGSAIQLMDYRDVQGRTFDKIVSVGMFEHVGRDHLPKYFDHIYSLLKPGGLFLNHGISSSSVPARSWWSRFLERYVVGMGSFSHRYIFPDSEVIPVSEVNVVAERTGFEVRHLENLREHYALTLRQWFARLEQNCAEAVRLTSEDIYRTWRFYLAVAVYLFETGLLNVNQTLLYKPPNRPGKHIVI